MATYKQVNQQTNIVSVGRTAPVPRGQQTKENSLPVVLASDAAPVPVVEQNKIASEVALSLLGIPRAEVALGIFADVNTYDVNPSEWSVKPIDRRVFTGAFDTIPTGIRKFVYEEGASGANYNWGLTHVPEEAGAMIEAPIGETTTLTSKRFFRYQPGRVSSATFGVKSSSSKDQPGGPSVSGKRYNRNPAIRKYGIYDKFDGYYWETRDTGKGDQFGVTRRTQSIIDFRNSHSLFSNSGGAGAGTTDYGITGKGKEPGEVFESVMNSPIAVCNGQTITLVGANTNRNQSFKNGSIPQIGMTIKNITNLLGTAPNADGTAGFKVNTDNSPLFRESTVVTSVAASGNDIVIGINQAPIIGAIWENSDGGNAVNQPGVNTLNGRAEANAFADSTSDQIGSGKKLSFSFAGENLIIRDNLPLVHAAIYDPSMLKDRVEYEIASASQGGSSLHGNFAVKFNLPDSATSEGVTADGVLSNCSPKLTRDFPSAHDDSSNGLYVSNIFDVGQIVEYTTDADAFADGTDDSIIKAGKNSIFQISAVDVINNQIFLRNIIQRGAMSLGAGNGRNSPTEISGDQINTNAISALGTTGTKHYIKTPVPWIFPDIEYSDTSTNVSDVMFPYARDFGVKLNPDQTSSQFTLTGDSHRGSTGGAGSTIGLLNTNLTDTSGNIDSTIFETYKAEINDINSGLSCASMTLGRTYGSDLSKSAIWDKASTDSGVTINSTLTLRQKNGVFNKKVVAGWRNWIQQNVKPEFYGVYEYKVPRSRFSFDSLNGETSETVYYSDVVKDLGKTRYPGQIKAGTDGISRNSLWDIDFANVIMKKIEFSWYGAVGALFLAYVPTGTGEARWVRVHHLRCSNQLKTASLGNATLPLTYDVYGGGAPKQQGNSTMQNTTYDSGKSVSEFITKYGSSYYIDGGDRGTVRLFNYAQPASTKIPQSRLFEKIVGIDGANEGGTSKNTFRINNVHGTGRADLYVGSTVRFGSSGGDTARVTWVERQGLNNSKISFASSPNVATVYLDRSITINSPAIFDINTAPIIFGLESKENIQSSQDFLVRNRVQVYPTKLSAGMTSSLGQKQTIALELTKNVQFQSDVIHNISNNVANERSKQFRFVGSDANLELAGSGLPTRLNKDTNLSPNFVVTGGSLSDTHINRPTSGPYYSGAAVGDKIYGWARVTDGVSAFTLFGRMEVSQLGPIENSPIYDFIPEDSYTGKVRFVNRSLFTHANQYSNNVSGLGSAGAAGGAIKGETFNTIGNTNSAQITSAINEDKLEIERLSSVRVNNEIRRPIPGTGIKIASLFLENGSEYFDLQPYFDYNKDYISFPLTNIPDNLFLGVKANSPANEGGPNTPQVSVSLTWEEQ